MTRSSNNWLSRPGNFDVLRIRRRHYPARNLWGFPELLPQRFTLPPSLPLLSYRERDDAGHRHAGALCHFFLDDYRFETVWTKPDSGLSRVGRYWGTLTPDFSLYADWPPILQQWNHYRRQWLGRYWQEHGIKIIPTVNWSTQDSHAWCFTGIPRRQIVALAVPDLRRPQTRTLFTHGYHAMHAALEPQRILVYGQLPAELQSPAVNTYSPDWVQLRQLTRSD